MEQETTGLRDEGEGNPVGKPLSLGRRHPHGEQESAR
jgi:hypothetical protein